MTTLSDYSTYKNGLDIVEALTKRLDRLTGFDSELDNILGGRENYGHSLYQKHNLSGKHICEQNFKENQPKPPTTSQDIEQSSASVDLNQSTAAQSATSTLHAFINETSNSELIPCIPDINLSAGVKKYLPSQPDLSEKLKSSCFDDPVYREICHSHHPTENSSKACSPQILASPRTNECFLTGTRDSGGSVLKRFLSIPSDGETSGYHNREAFTSGGVVDINSTHYNDQQYDHVFHKHSVDAAALQSALAQHILNVECENSRFRGELLYELSQNRSEDHWSDGKGNSEFYRPFPFYNPKALTSLETEKLHSNFSPTLDLCPERTNASSLHIQTSFLKAETHKCFSSRVENSSTAEEPSVSLEILNTVERNNFSFTKGDDQGVSSFLKDDRKGIEKILEDVSISNEEVLSRLPLIDHVSKEDKFSYPTSIARSSVSDPEDFFTASECSGTTTPSFVTARDRESVLSWKLFSSEAASVGKGRSFRMTPVMKDISEIFMTDKSFTNDYRNYIDSHKNAADHFAGANTDPLLSPVPHQQSREEDGMHFNHLPESSQGNLKEQSCFTTLLEEVQQKHRLKSSPLQGCAETREELSRELPLHSGQDDREGVKERSVTVGAFQPLKGMHALRSERSDQYVGSIVNETQLQPYSSFSTLEEVRDIQHIKLSPLEGCSLNSQVTTTEFSPRDYLTLKYSGQAVTSPEQNRTVTSPEQNRTVTSPEQNRTVTSPEQNRTVTSLESEHYRNLTSPEQNILLPITINSESKQEIEKWKDWNRDEISMFNPDISQPSNSFSTLEEVRDIQHIKLSPLEGCSLNSQVTTTEFSPRDYLTLKYSGQAVTSPEQNRTVTSPEQNRIVKSSEQIRSMTSSEEQSRILTSLEQNRTVTSPEQITVLPIPISSESRQEIEKWKDWNRDEMSMFNPDNSQPSNSFSTLEEVRDIQHIKLSPLEGCSLNTQVTTTEFSPRDYLTLKYSGPAVTSSEEHNRIMMSSEPSKTLTSLESEHNRNIMASPSENLKTNTVSLQNRTLTSQEDQNEHMTSAEQSKVLPITLSSESSRDVERRKDWNREELSMFNPDISQPCSSFSTLEEVRDIQHIKLSPLEGCSLNSQVTTTEFSPRDYLTLKYSGQAVTSPEQNRTVTSTEQNRTVTSPEQNRIVKSSEQIRSMTSSEEQCRILTSLEQNRTVTSPEQITVLPIPINSESRQEIEKWKDWNRDEISMFNPDISQPSNSFSTLEEVRDIQHIKLSPLEGCSLNSQVTTTEFSPRDYLTLNYSGPAVTSSEEHNRVMMSSEPSKTLTSLESEHNRNSMASPSENLKTNTVSLQNRTLTPQEDQNEHMTSAEQSKVLPITLSSESSRDVERRKDWNREELSMFNPDISQPCSSFSTLEEVRDIQHIKLSPLEGCSLNSQVTTTEFSPATI